MRSPVLAAIDFTMTTDSSMPMTASASAPPISDSRLLPVSRGRWNDGKALGIGPIRSTCPLVQPAKATTKAVPTTAMKARG